jgi:hypothetical protein
MTNMKAIPTHILVTALALAVAATLAGQVRADSELVKFPDSYTAGVLYATVGHVSLLPTRLAPDHCCHYPGVGDHAYPPSSQAGVRPASHYQQTVKRPKLRPADRLFWA